MKHTRIPIGSSINFADTKNNSVNAEGIPSPSQLRTELASEENLKKQLSWMYLALELLLSQAESLHQLIQFSTSRDSTFLQTLKKVSQKTLKRNSKLVKTLRRKYLPSQEWNFRSVDRETLEQLFSILASHQTKPIGWYSEKVRNIEEEAA